MATLTATIDASQRTIALSGDVSAAVPGRLYAIEDEIVLLEGFGDWPNSVGVALAGDQNRASWIVKRGQEGSTPATHTSSTTVYAVTDGFAKSGSLSDPSPVAIPTLAQVLVVGQNADGNDITGVWTLTGYPDGQDASASMTLAENDLVLAGGARGALVGTGTSSPVGGGYTRPFVADTTGKKLYAWTGSDYTQIGDWT